MTTKLMSGNEALALGALQAGVKVVTGYPGTPSTGALGELLAMDPPGVHVEWSTNEKVAFEIAAGAAWAGQRALCTMKMSGVNVAYDSLISVAYSGQRGRAGDLRGRRPGRQRRHGGTGFARLRLHVRPGRCSSRRQPRDLPADADGLRAFGADRHARSLSAW